MTVPHTPSVPRLHLPKTALITGASRGLGRSLALALARQGTAVALVARHQEPLAAVVADIRRTGGTAVGLVADVAAPGIAARLAGEAAAHLGDLDLVIHNASTLGPVPLAPLAEGDQADLERVLAVNLVAPFALARATVGSMVLRQTGAQLFISSDAAREPYPTWGLYGASKAGLEQLARILAAEVEGTGVQVLSVDPGEMDTDMHRDAIPDADPSTLQHPDDAARAILARLYDVTAASAQPAARGAHSDIHGSTP